MLFPSCINSTGKIQGSEIGNLLPNAAKEFIIEKSVDEIVHLEVSRMGMDLNFLAEELKILQ